MRRSPASARNSAWIKEAYPLKISVSNKVAPAPRGWRQDRTAWLFMAPFLLLFSVFVLIPVAASMALSFTSFDMLQTPKWVFLDNYRRLFLEDDVFLIAVKNTFFFAVITGPLGYLLSFVMAWFINELNRGVRSVLTLFMYAPSLAGNVYFIWLYIFSGDSKGMINSLLLRMGLITSPVQFLTDSRYNFAIVVLVMIWLSLGTGFLSFIAGFQGVDKTYFEAAALDGVRNRFQELWYITLPQMVPQLMFGAVMSISAAFAVGYQCQALTGFPSSNYSTHTVLLHMLDYGTSRFEMGYACTVAVVLFAVMVLTWALVNFLLRKLSSD